MSIGIFDSGLGGLSVLRHAQIMYPNEQFVYFADQARAPYGDRTRGEVYAFTSDVVDRFRSQGAKGIVIACNTASDVALDAMRRLHSDTPFVGIEPAVKPAVATSNSNIVGVLATSRTIEGSRLRALIGRYAGTSTVLTQACPGVVELVEDGLADSPQAAALLGEYAAPLLKAGADTIVLGCTHYTFVADTLRNVVGPNVTIVDPAEAVARQIERVIPLGATAGGVRFETSGDPVRMRNQLAEMFGELVPVHSPL